MATVFPDKTINYRVYDDGNDVIGTASVDLPEINYMADTLSGAGLAGEVETPVLGHIQAMSVTLHWNTILSENIGLLNNSGRTLTLRSSQQQMNSGTGVLESVPVKIVLKTLPKSASLGSFEPAAGTGTDTELEVTYIKIEVNGNELAEIDKFNYIFSINGEDLLSTVRSDLGI